MIVVMLLNCQYVNYGFLISCRSTASMASLNPFSASKGLAGLAALGHDLPHAA